MWDNDDDDEYDDKKTMRKVVVSITREGLGSGLDSRFLTTCHASQLGFDGGGDEDDDDDLQADGGVLMVQIRDRNENISVGISASPKLLLKN